MQPQLKKALLNIIVGISSLVLLRLLLIASPLLQQLDQAVYAIVISFRTTGLTIFMRAVTLVGLEGFMLSGALFFIFLLFRRHYVAAVHLTALFIGTYLLQDTMKVLFAVPRPPVSYWLVVERTASFPSGHALAATILFGFAYWFVVHTGVNRYVRFFACVIAIAGTLLVGLSRIYLGVHWPSDVIAGWILGAFWLRAVLR